MDRLRPPPDHLPLRTLAWCSVGAVGVLWMGGGSTGDAFRLVTGILPVGASGEILIRAMLGRAWVTFWLISLALGTGLGLALAITLLLSGLGSLFSKCLGWLGRAIAGVPPMAWALGAIVLVIQRWGLPVETLFAYETPPGSDTFALRLGCSLWAWMVPAFTLALPVAGTALYSLTHRLDLMLRDPMLWQLKARGLAHSAIVYRHLVPQLRVHLVRFTRPCMVMLLAFSIPVEEILGFDGLGRTTAEALRAHDAPQLAGVLYLSGFLLAAWQALLGVVDRKSLPAPLELVESNEQTRSWLCVVLGTALMVLLADMPRWLPGGLMQLFQEGFAGTADEVLPALGVSAWAALLIVLSGPAMCLVRRWQRLPHSGVAATLAAGPLLVMWLALASASQNFWTVRVALVLGIAMPGAAAFREAFREGLTSRPAEAARASGLRTLGIWRHHVIPQAAPAMLNMLLRNVSTVLLWTCLASFFHLQTGTVPESGPAWGLLIHTHGENILDDPWPALAPALLLALWSLSFRLVSRAFRTENPAPRTSPFDLR